jgi:hypothetical protein
MCDNDKRQAGEIPEDIEITAGMRAAGMFEIDEYICGFRYDAPVTERVFRAMISARNQESQRKAAGLHEPDEDC